MCDNRKTLLVNDQEPEEVVRLAAYLNHASGRVAQEGQVVQHIVQHRRFPSGPRMLQRPLAPLHWTAAARR